MDIKKIINNFVDTHAGEIEAAIRSALAKEKPISKIEAGDHFEYKGIEWVCLDTNNITTVFAITAKIIANMPFSDKYEDGCNNWKTSPLRKWLNGDFLDKNLDENVLLSSPSILTADNGDDKYGITCDYVTLLSCDLYREYRRFIPKYDDWVWTLTPCSCDVGYAYTVRYISPSGGLCSSYAGSTIGVAPVCLFNLNYLASCGQARIITHK